MLGFSYGEVFLLLGATAALIGPKDLPIIARTVGRFAGRSIGYVQLARGQLESVRQQSQARQVHKLVDNINTTARDNMTANGPQKSDEETKQVLMRDWQTLKSVSIEREGLSELTDESGSIVVLPVSAESAGLLPKRVTGAKGSDIVLEAILEADVAKNAKEFLTATKPIKK
ncbi:hypothetical protein KY289_032911 [Solanum tuberosum]|nr:hypothetical protein KY289_032911 [Solanum tuberosum]